MYFKYLISLSYSKLRLCIYTQPAQRDAYASCSNTDKKNSFRLPESHYTAQAYVTSATQQKFHKCLNKGIVKDQRYLANTCEGLHPCRRSDDIMAFKTRSKQYAPTIDWQATTPISTSLAFDGKPL